MPALLGRTRPNIPVLIRLRSNNFPVDLADIVPVSDTLAGPAAAAAQHVYVPAGAVARAQLLYGTRGTVVAFLPPAWVTSVPAALADTVPVSDGITRQTSTPRALADTAPISDSPAAAVSLPRALADTVPVSDSLAGPVAAPARPTVLVVSGAAARARQMYAARANLVAFIPPAWVASSPAALGDTVPVSDTVTRGAASSPRAVADTVPVSDAVSGTAVSGSPPPVRVLAVNQAALQRAAQLLGRPNGFDLIPPAETSTLPASLADTVPVSDTLARGGARPRASADTVPVSDTVTGSAGSGRAVADTVPVSDTLTRGGAARPRALGDTVPVTDAVATGNGRAVADVVTISDGITVPGAARPRAAADTALVNDTLARGAAARPRAVADAVPVSDVLAAGPTNARALTDTVPISDTVTQGPAARSRALADVVPISDTVARTRRRRGHLHGRRHRRHHGGPGAPRHE